MKRQFQFRWGHYTGQRAKENPALARKVDIALNASWKEGAVTQLMTGAFDYYLIPYALLLGASTQEIGVLVSVPHLVAALSQIFAVQAVQLAGTRSALLQKGTLVQAIFMLPLVILPLFSVRGRVAGLIVIMIVFRVLASLIGPAWGSLMSDYLPESQRGEYFGWRSRLIGIAGVAGVGLWGLLLSSLNAISSTSAFVAVFACATIFRFISFYYMRCMVDLPLHHSPRVHFTFDSFLRRLKESNFVRFLLFVTTVTFGTQLSVAYFSVYLLQEMHISYLSYMGVQLASATVMLITFPLWGKQADLNGNATVLKVTGFLAFVIPLLWFLGRVPYHFMLAEAFAGFVWSGFNLSTSNFIYESVSPARRVRFLGYYNLLNSTATFLGAYTGGWLAAELPPVRGSSILTLFLVSAGARFLAVALFSRSFEEVRLVGHRIRSTRLILSVLGVRPLVGRNIEST